MRRNSLFWGILVILLGVLFLLDNLNILPINAWQLFWPLVLILVGLWFLFGRYIFRRAPLETLSVSIPVENARQATVKIHHGAGKIIVGVHGSPAELLQGTFAGGVEQRVERSGDSVMVDLRAPSDVVFAGPWSIGNEGFTYDFTLNRNVAFALDIETGASENRLALTDARLTDLRIQTGASSTDVQLPAAAGFTRVVCKSGAASMTLSVPAGVAASIRSQSGLTDERIDTIRFPRIGDHRYESPDYASAANKVEISIESGVGSVAVR